MVVVVVVVVITMVIVVMIVMTIMTEFLGWWYVYEALAAFSFWN
jgi:hypothetical protein